MLLTLGITYLVFGVVGLVNGNGNSLVLPKARTFTTQMDHGGQHALAEHLQFLCDLKYSAEDNAWISQLQASTLEKAWKPEDSPEEREMKQTLAEGIISKVISNCEPSEEVQQDAPAKEKGERQVAEANYVENILQNVFSGNIIGVIQTYSGRLRPASMNRMSSSVSDVFRSFLTNVSSMRGSFSNFSLRGLRGPTSTTTPKSKYFGVQKSRN